MRPPKINDHKLLRLIDRQGMNQTEAAKELGVSRQAMSRRLQEIRGKTTKVIVAKKIEKVVEQKIDIIDQLQKINSDANEILDLLMRWGRGDKEAIQILEKKPAKLHRMNDPHELALKAMAEIRNQLMLQFKILGSLYSLQKAEKFQKTVVDILGDVDPEIRMEVIRRLQAEHSIRSVLRYS